MENTIRYSARQLTDFCVDAFTGFGFSREEAEKITDVLILADLFDIKSHGTQRLAMYHRNIRIGWIKPEAKPDILFETPVSAVIDGHDGMGQLNALFAMEVALEKARRSGMASVTVRNSNHFGIAGYYAKMASDAGFFGMAMTNSEAIMVPTHAKKALLGTNPIAVSFPAEPYPFLFDASTTVVPRGKLEVYNKSDKPLPEGWAVDENGQPCTDAARVLKNIQTTKAGGIMPLGGADETNGGHKGYGWAMLCELFCSVFSGAPTSNHSCLGDKCGTGHGFLVIDPAVFGDPDAMKARFSAFLQELRDAPVADGQTRIYTHGEKEALAFLKRSAEGIDVNINTLGEMKALCGDLGLDFRKYLGDVDLSLATKKSTYL